MLYYSRWKTAAILGVTVLVCLAAVPSALPAATFSQLPAWAQRKLSLGYDLQGGARYQFAVDIDAVRHIRLEELRDDVRRVLREQRVGYASLQIRNGAVEFWIREADDMRRALSGLEQLTSFVRSPGGNAPEISDGMPSVTATRDAQIRPPEVIMDVADRMVRLSWTEAAIRERVTRDRNVGADITERRLRDTGIPYMVKRVGEDRLFVETFDSSERWRWMLN